MRLAGCLIVKPDDSEAQALRTALRYLAPHVDRLFITITGENQAVREVAELFGAEVSTFEWCNDFAAARNFNFSQAKDYDYIIWCDADDAFRGLENLRATMEAHPADCYSMNYLYAFDEYRNPIVVHQKTQIVKNDGSVSWEGQLHEDFKENRTVSRFFIKGIERLHLSDAPRFEQAKERNLVVAQSQVTNSPNDPRSYWNLGNSLKALDRNQEAIQAFDTFLKTSLSDDEKYIARLRRAEAYWALGRKEEAIDECRYAIGTKPHYPDAYHLAGSLFLESHRYKEAEQMYKTGLVLKPPYYSIIVFNPRDYDYVPLMNLAKVYYQQNLPQLALPCLEACLKIQPNDESLKNTIKIMKREARKADKLVALAGKLNKIQDKDKLRKELDKVPTEFVSHPAICNIRNVNFVKTESSGKDLVFVCGYTEEPWTPETAKKKGIGGSEEAIIHLAEKFSKNGYNVTVYNNCGHKEKTFGAVTYKPFWAWNYRDKQDITILWRHPKMADFEINSSKIFLDLHDVLPEGELTEARLKRIDKIFVKSRFHRSLFPKVHDAKFVIVPNGIDSSLFTESLNRDPFLMINTSSPDRGLKVLVKLFKKVKERIPQAKLKWAYGWTVFDTVHGNTAPVMKWKDELVKEMEAAGVENLGRLSHPEVAQLYMQAGIFAYPTEFAEIDCISYSKACAGGAIPVTTDFAALGEKNLFGKQVHSNKTKDTWSKPYQFDFSLEDEAAQQHWVDLVVETMSNVQDREPMRSWARDTFDWNKIAAQWLKEFNV